MSSKIFVYTIYICTANICAKSLIMFIVLFKILLCISIIYKLVVFSYERLLRRARTEDLSEISGIGCLYQSGVDRFGRPVIVFVGKWFKFNEINLDKALLYLIHLLDPLVKGDYVITYFHTLTSNANYPSFNWLKEVYNILPYK